MAVVHNPFVGGNEPGLLALKPSLVLYLRNLWNFRDPVTGSVVLHYDADQHDEFHGDFRQHLPAGQKPPTNEIDEMAKKIEEEAEFLAEHSQTARAVVDFFKDMDRQIKCATGNLIDLKIVLAVGIIGFTVFEVGASAATPVWVTLVIFSLNHFIEMHPPGARIGRTPAAAMA